MSDRTLRSRSARSSVYVVQEELRNMRRYVADPNPDWTRIAASAHALSSSLKRLYKFLGDLETTPAQRRADEPPARINIAALASAIENIRLGRVCGRCGGLEAPPPSEPDAPAAIVDDVARARARNAAQRRT